jgi:hypothetical protein
LQIKRIERSFSGFHHDYLCELENSGVVQLLNKQVCPKTGVIKADVVWNGVKQQKTLFPSHWTREQVIEKILEAYKNFQDVPKFHNGKWIVESMTNEGMKIKIVISEQAKVMTAYPLI